MALNWNKVGAAPLKKKKDLIANPTQEPAKKDFSYMVPRAIDPQRIADPNSTKVTTINQNADGSTTVTYEDGRQKTMSAAEENARNIQVAGSAGLSLKKSPETTTQQIQTANNEAQAAQIQAQQSQQRGLMQEQLVGNIESNPIDYRSALRAGITQGLTNAAGAAATGATGGALLGLSTAGATSGPLALAGGVGGAVGGYVYGFFQGVKTNLNEQRTDSINSQKAVLTTGNTNLRKLNLLMKADPNNRPEYIASVQAQLNKIKRAQLQMEQDARNDPFKFKSAKQDLSDFENFYAPGGAYENHLMTMRNSLANPNVDPMAAQALMQETISAQ